MYPGSKNHRQPETADPTIPTQPSNVSSTLRWKAGRSHRSFLAEYLILRIKWIAYSSLIGPPECIKDTAVWRAASCAIGIPGSRSFSLLLPFSRLSGQMSSQPSYKLKKLPLNQSFNPPITSCRGLSGKQSARGRFRRANAGRYFS